MGMDFFLEEVLLCIMDWYFGQKLQMFRLVFYKHNFSINEMWIDGLEWITCVLLWCLFIDIDLFGLSFWRHPSTAEDLLMSKWWRDTFLQICSD